MASAASSRSSSDSDSPSRSARTARVSAPRCRPAQRSAPGVSDSFGTIPATVMEPSSRSEEHTSELQSLMRISYAVFCLKKKKIKKIKYNNRHDINKLATPQKVNREVEL